MEPWIDNGLLSLQSARPSLYGLEFHLATMIKQVDAFKPDVAVVDPLSALVIGGSLHQTQGMLLRLIDHLKTMGVTSLFTSLQTDAVHTDIDVSSIMDAWVSE